MIMMRIFTPFLLLLLVYVTLPAQHIKAFYIGHSLSDQIPDMVKSLSDDHEEVSFDWVYQWIPGAPLWWQWERQYDQGHAIIDPHYYGFYDPQHGLPAGDFDVLVLTESVPRHWSSIGDTYSYVDSFFAFATRYNPDIQVYLYEDWHCLLSGDPTGCDYDMPSAGWRQRLTDDLPMWESVLDTINSRYNPANPVCMIPAGQGLARLYDSIEAGAVPGITHISQLFSDDIHLTDQGKYFVACVHFAMIHRTSPVGLRRQLQVWWGGDFDAPSEALALVMQQIAWETVQAYPRTCLGSSTSVPSAADIPDLTIAPNPASQTVHLQYAGEAQPWVLSDLLGRIRLSGSARELDISGLPTGLYLIRFGRAGHTYPILRMD